MFADMFVLGLADMIHEWKLKHMGCLHSDNKHFQNSGNAAHTLTPYGKGHVCWYILFKTAATFCCNN